MSDGDVERLASANREGETHQVRRHLVGGVGLSIEGEEWRRGQRARQHIQRLRRVDDERVGRLRRGGNSRAWHTRRWREARAFLRQRLKLVLGEKAQLRGAIFFHLCRLY